MLLLFLNNFVDVKKESDFINRIFKYAVVTYVYSVTGLIMTQKEEQIYIYICVFGAIF